MAEIQAALPNGTYRAIVAQREIILALPHTAKAGDSLELEVVENDGHLALALSKDPKGSSGTETITRESVATSLSRTGKLIGDLLSPPGKEGQKPVSLTLNRNEPIFDVPPQRGSDLVPALRQSIVQSGMFYESHQAAWAEGKLPTAMLMAEPQGQFSLPATQQQASNAPDTNPFADALQRPIEEMPAPPPDDSEQQLLHNNTQASQNQSDSSPIADNRSQEVNTYRDLSPMPDRSENRAHNPIPQSLTPIIQQQLEAFASQNYAWQGTAWPGQQMEWEITEEKSHDSSSPDSDDYRWQTQLRLQLPLLGDVAATLRLRGDNQVDVQIQTTSLDSEIQLSLGGPTLNEQMDNAGLYLATFGVTHKSDNQPSDFLREENEE